MSRVKSWFVAAVAVAISVETAVYAATEGSDRPATAETKDAAAKKPALASILPKRDARGSKVQIREGRKPMSEGAWSGTDPIVLDVTTYSCVMTGSVDPDVRLTRTASGALGGMLVGGIFGGPLGLVLGGATGVVGGINPEAGRWAGIGSAGIGGAAVAGTYGAVQAVSTATQASFIRDLFVLIFTGGQEEEPPSPVRYDSSHVAYSVQRGLESWTMASASAAQLQKALQATAPCRLQVDAKSTRTSALGTTLLALTSDTKLDPTRGKKKMERLLGSIIQETLAPDAPKTSISGERSSSEERPGHVRACVYAALCGKSKKPSLVVVLTWVPQAIRDELAPHVVQAREAMDAAKKDQDTMPFAIAVRLPGEAQAKAQTTASQTSLVQKEAQTKLEELQRQSMERQKEVRCYSVRITGVSQEAWVANNCAKLREEIEKAMGQLGAEMAKDIFPSVSVPS